MSSGQLARTPDNFPRMKYRAAHRHHRRRQALVDIGPATAGELLDWVLPSIGVHVPRSTLYRWAHKRTIPARGYQGADGRITDHRIHSGDPEVYRLGDVLAAAARDTTTRKATP